MAHYTLDQVKAAALDYYKRGCLGAQYDKAGGACLYAYGASHKFRCAIGAVFNDEDIKLVGPIDCGLMDLVKHYPEITFSNLNSVSKIQVAHDSWLSATPQGKKGAEEDFLRLISPAGECHSTED